MLASQLREVLVHCAKGISRSTSVAMAWLMREKGWTFAQALDRVEAKRKTAFPNVGFQVRGRLRGVLDRDRRSVRCVGSV